MKSAGFTAQEIEAITVTNIARAMTISK
jgi:hypothetical protein